MDEVGRQKFGEYIKALRLRSQYTLRDVEQAIGFSNSYLNQVEKGEKNPPKPEILRRLASLYRVNFASIMAAAGFQEQEAQDLYVIEVERAYKYAMDDPEFTYGTHMTTLSTNELPLEAKRFIVELYQKTTSGIDLLSRIKQAEATRDASQGNDSTATETTP